MRILLATSELYPYSKTGGLADMVAALGKTLARQGHKVGVVTPLYGPILQKAGELGLERMDWNLTLMLDWRTVQGSVWYLNKDGQDIYFIGQQELFNRPGIYQENGHDYFDNPERFIFFSKAVENLAMYLPWQPEMVHVHDWQTSLVPLLLTHSMESGKLKRAVGTCLTIHNLAYQGVYASSVFAMANLPWGYFGPSGSEFYGNFNFLKTGIVFSDKLTTVSPQYAKEIQGQEYGANLNGVLNQRQNDLVGILNGADYDVWNTEKNPALKYSYSLKNMSGKAKNKQALQEKLGLPQNPQIPLFGNIGRMAEQKGIDILIPALEDMLAGDIQFVCLGSGSAKYEEQVNQLRARYPDKVAVYIGYNNELAHQITAAADFFLMPSRYEPCGLNQMYSLRYGTLPIVRATGGLVDSVIDPSESVQEADGFKFTNYNSNHLARTILKAMAVYYSPEKFKLMRSNAMKADFSWDVTAKKYTAVYESIFRKVT